MSSYPFKAEICDSRPDTEFWWPVSSSPEDEMIVGDAVPGDKVSAEFAARCCNIVYVTAVEEVLALINESAHLSLDEELIIKQLTGA
jgi:hypothetical protein